MVRDIRDYFNNEENRKAAIQCRWEIGVKLRGAASQPTVIILVCYLLSKISKFIYPFCSLADILANKPSLIEDAVVLAKKHLSEPNWEELNKLVEKYPPEIFVLAVLLPITNGIEAGERNTPESIINLSKAILDITPTDRVADIGCGAGSFLTSVDLENASQSCSGYEINGEAKAIASMRADLVGEATHIYLQDVFTISRDKNTSFDKLFSNYPFGLQLRKLDSDGQYLNQLLKKIPGLSKAASSDWVFNALLCELLSPAGKAVGIMTSGSTWNTIDAPMRKYFVESGLVEAVIAMPARMFLGTSISTAMIVFSHGNTEVQLVDASAFFQTGRRQNEFSNEDIDTIVSLLKVNSNFSQAISYNELRKNEYNLSLMKYKSADIVFRNGAAFGSVIKKLTRGAPCTASQLDEMVADGETNMQYLMLSNIQNGIIDDKLPYLAEIDPKFEKYCLKNNNLILSKNGFPYKAAVVVVQNDRRILANGNLYIIELDERRANPYYIKAFFESEPGIAVLKSITVGTSIPNIGVDKLKKVQIPLPSIEEQNRIAKKYLAALDEVSIAKQRFEEKLHILHHILEDEDVVG